MKQYKQDFIKLLVKAEALKFGEFTLKSGRIAPYFLNAGAFFTGEYMTGLAKAYAGAYMESGFEVDVIYGPAYKGIPLCVGCTEALYKDFGKNLSYCFNRKEVKKYGMKDSLVGAKLDSDTRVLLIDDVITAGIAVRESVEFLKENGGAELEGILIAMDRMEKNNDGVNAVAELEETLGVKVFPIVTLDDVIEVLYGREVGGKVYIDEEMMETIRAYRAEYGA